MLTGLCTVTCICLGGSWYSLWPHPFALAITCPCLLCVEGLCSSIPNLVIPEKQSLWYQVALLVSALRMWVSSEVHCSSHHLHMFRCLWRRFYLKRCHQNCPRSSSFIYHSQVGASLELVLIKSHQALQTKDRLVFHVKCLSVSVNQVWPGPFVYECSMVELVIAAESRGL